MPIYEPELPLEAGILPLLAGLSMPGCIRDAAPDAWGRRVIERKRSSVNPAELDELSYLLASGSDRIGALDFQCSPSEYRPRAAPSASLAELTDFADRIERGVPLSPELDLALIHGSSVGGARPKALIQGKDKKYLAKFSASSDSFSMIKAEYIAMRLAALAGLKVAPVRLVRDGVGRAVLLVERFDRIGMDCGWARKAVVSALTLLGLDEDGARYASYGDLAEIVRHRFSDPKQTLAELCARLVFNILCGNTDDHARNHAAFWNGKELMLTPAYDICPQIRTGGEAVQAMLIHGDKRFSQLKTCLAAASSFLLSEEEVRSIFTRQKTVVREHWDSLCAEAELSEVDKQHLWQRQFLNPFAMQGL